MSPRLLFFSMSDITLMFGLRDAVPIVTYNIIEVTISGDYWIVMLFLNDFNIFL